MSRPAQTPTPRFPQTIIGLALLAGPASAPLPAQQAPSSCALLQVAELEAAIGSKASAKPSGAKMAVPGMTVDECSVGLPGSGANYTVTIRLVTKLAMDGAQALTIRNRDTASEEQWKRPGARLEQTTVGKAICILSGRPNVGHAICSIPRGDGYVEVDVFGPLSKLPTLAAVGALVQKANSRL